MFDFDTRKLVSQSSTEKGEVSEFNTTMYQDDFCDITTIF